MFSQTSNILYFHKAPLNGGIGPPALEHSYRFNRLLQKNGLFRHASQANLPDSETSSKQRHLSPLRTYYTRAPFFIHGAKRGCWQEEEEETEQCDSDVQGRLAAEESNLIKTAFYSKGLCICFLSIMAKSKLNGLHKSEKMIVNKAE